MVRIASFNVENLFARPKAFRATDHAIAQPILDAYAAVCELIQKPVYSDADKEQIRNLLVVIDVYCERPNGAIRRRDSRDPQWAWLRKNRGTFDREPTDPSKDVEIIASGRGDWIGWIELAKEPVNDTGVAITAKTIREVGADIVGIVEAEDRPSLRRFNQERLDNFYAHTMLIDGNDERGIDVAIMTRAGFPIESIRSNVDRKIGSHEVFSRDCAEYTVRTPNGTVVHVLVNHFKSQSGGGADKRKKQAGAVRDIVDGLVEAGGHVVVLGDLNEGPTEVGGHAASFGALYGASSPLVECYALPGFDVGARPGTFDSCGIRNRLDYIFVSESLAPHVTGGGLFRKGLWGSRVGRPDGWETYSEMTRSVEQASDHSLVYLDLDI